MQKCLKSLSVHDSGHTLYKVVDVREYAVFFAFSEDCLHDVLTESLDAAETEADFALLVDCELGIRLIDIRIEYLDAVLLAVVHDLLDLVHVGEVLGQVGCLELGWIVGFKPSGLVAHPCVAGRMGLVEGIRCELLPVCPDLLEHVLRMSVLCTSFDKEALEAVQHVLELLTHGLTERICLTSGEVGKLTRQKHHLLLIYCDTVCVLECLLHVRKVIHDRLTALLTLYEVRNIVHRARTIEGVHRNEVFETCRLELDKPLLHTRRLELEYAGSVSTAVKLVCKWVFDIDLLYVEFDAVALLDVCLALLYDRQCSKSKEVHLEHSHLLDVVSVVLRHPHILASELVVGDTDRNELGKVSSADDHGTCVHSGLTYTPLKLAGICQYLLGKFGTVLQLILKVVMLQTVNKLRLDFLLLFLSVLVKNRLSIFVKFVYFERLVRNHLGQSVRLLDRHAADARNVLDRRLCGHRTICDNVRDLLLAVLLFDILEHPVASIIVKVNIHIRHVDTVRVEESLEEEVVLDRVDIGDLEAVCHCRTCSRTTSRTY